MSLPAPLLGSPTAFQRGAGRRSSKDARGLQGRAPSEGVSPGRWIYRGLPTSTECWGEGVGPGSLVFMGGGDELLIGVWGGAHLTWAVLGLVIHHEGPSCQPSASLLLPPCSCLAGTASPRTDTAVDPLPGGFRESGLGWTCPQERRLL